MGKFGRHSQFIIDCSKEAHTGVVQPYIVPYNDVSDVIRDDGADADDFGFEWRRCLDRAKSSFETESTSTWAYVYEVISKDRVAIGAGPDEALEFFMSVEGHQATAELLAKFRDIHNASFTNTEALRKLVRKFDKKSEQQGGESTQSKQLLPTLYTANFVLGLASIQASMEFLREILSLEDEDDDKGSVRSLLKHEEGLSMKADELTWFRKGVNTLMPSDLESIVAHRGFHCTDDRSDLRPIENTLASFEYAWTAGVAVCECDVGLTLDEKIVMAHDESFVRLALNATNDSSIQHVSDLTLKDLMALPLKSGTRPPLLIDALRSAMAIGEHAKLVIEIKPGNKEICQPLLRLFARHPVLFSRVAVIMSFDLYIMKMIGAQMAEYSLAAQARTMGSSSVTRKTLARPSKYFLSPRWSASFDISDSTLEGSEPTMPKLLLLTTAEPSPTFYTWSVADPYSFDDLLADSNLDGVYVEYEPAMLTTGKATMLELAEKWTVGVWMMAKRDPDNLLLSRRLSQECKVSFINSDFPNDFFSHR